MRGALDAAPHRTRQLLGLTRREQQIVPLIAKGVHEQGNRESLLLFREQTVKNHF